MKTIEEVSKFLGVSPTQKIKTLALMQVSEDPKSKEPRTRAVIVLLRGDHMLNEAKLSTALGGKETRPMHPEEIQQLFRSPAGYLGPVGLAAFHADIGGSQTQSSWPTMRSKDERTSSPAPIKKTFTCVMSLRAATLV